jgi:hypothetical protein
MFLQEDRANHISHNELHWSLVETDYCHKWASPLRTNTAVMITSSARSAPLINFPSLLLANVNLPESRTIYVAPLLYLFFLHFISSHLVSSPYLSDLSDDSLSA